MQVTIRKFERRDIPDKVRWINDPANNRYLHYDLPLEVGKTEAWFDKNRDRTDRADYVIECDGVPCGLIGLLSIDRKNAKAEYYVAMGEQSFKGKGVATAASRLLLDEAFGPLGLERVYLSTEAGNVAAQKLYERLGFRHEGVARRDLFSHGVYADRVLFGICRDEYPGAAGRTPDVSESTPVCDLGMENGNHLYIKRDDMIPFSFGGNKARKAALFFREIDAGDYDCVVTYGSSSSNHCRVVSNMAAARGMACYIISPEEASEPTFNSRMMELFGAHITVCPVTEVHDTIENTLASLREAGKKPFFIAGGGHGNTGTQAYVDCFREILAYEARTGIHFDYIFHASGTGTTQAGLVCGKLLESSDTTIVGISIARRNPRGRNVVLDSVRTYLEAQGMTVDEAQEALIRDAVIFDDSYTAGGYADTSTDVDETIRDVLTRFGIPLDQTYTGKAFTGMKAWLGKNGIGGKNVLFIHTGGTPLYFDYLRR